MALAQFIFYLSVLCFLLYFCSAQYYRVKQAKDELKHRTKYFAKYFGVPLGDAQYDYRAEAFVFVMAVVMLLVALYNVAQTFFALWQ